MLRFDGVIVDALELGPLRLTGPELSSPLLERLQTATPSGIPSKINPIIQTLVTYYIASKPEDSDWVVLPVTNFDAYFDGISFSKKYLWAIPEIIMVRDGTGFGVHWYKMAGNLLIV